MPATLAQRVKAKYPGAYDDLSDLDLEAKVKARYPIVYDDLPMTGTSSVAIGGSTLPRTLDESEFNAIKDSVLKAAPAGLSEEEFYRYIGPKFQEALAKAENLPNGQSVPADEKRDPNTIGTFARHVGQQLNPVGVGQMIPFPKEAGGAGWDAPLQAGKHLLAAQGAVFDKAKAAYDKGDYVGAASHALYWLMPVIGPVLDKAGTDLREGKTASALGDTVGVAASLAGPKALSEATAGGKLNLTGLLAKNPNAAEAAAVQFGQARGIPVDAGTATGNRFVKGSQALADSSPLGSVVATRARAAQAAALKRVGGELAQQASEAGYVTPEQAGAGIKEGVRSLTSTMGDVADEAYGKLRTIEENPANSVEVHTAPAGSPTYHAILKKLGSGSEAPTLNDLYGMRQIEAELDATPFSKKMLRQTDKGNSYEPVEGVGGAGAPVYHDIVEAMPEGGGTRAEIQAAIKKTLETGEWTNAARGALSVVRDRAMDTFRSGPSLAADAPLIGGTERVQLPVALGDTKKALRPIYNKLSQEAQIAPMTIMGGKARALIALKTLMEAPEHAPVSVVDAALGDLKSAGRAEIPELRTQGQGIMAFAVKHLDKAVREAVEKAGPEATAALEEGRAATVAKYQAGDVLEDIRAEPVKAFQQMTAAQDSGIAFLRQVREMAPQSIPGVARATIEQLLDRATAEGGFDKARGLQADWQKLGPETKRILYPGEGQVKALDNFFLLAKKLEENPNPSGTALTLNSGAQFGLMFTHPMTGIPVVLGSGALSKLLHSERGVQALTRGLSVSLTPASGAIRTSALLNLVQAARVAGVDLSAAPAAADRDPPGAPN